MSSSRGGYQPQACNLCWKELQAPFLVTSCNHVFCLSHRDHEAFQQQSCPGCGHHLSASKGLKQANYDVKSSDLSVLNGVTPDAALKVAGTAIKFWVQQERTQLNYMQHQAERAQASKDDQRERFEEAYREAKDEMSNAVADKEQAQLQNEELARENQTLHQKLQSQAQKVRALEETVVKLKRGAPDSPSRRASPSRSPSRAIGAGQPLAQPSPLRGESQMFSPLRGDSASSLLSQTPTFTSQRSRLGVATPLHPSPSLHQHQRLSSPAPSHGATSKRPRHVCFQHAPARAGSTGRLTEAGRSEGQPEA